MGQCFGSLLAATDSVSVLAIFKQAQVDSTLYAYAFGESMLNDAVAIVLYTTSIGFLGTTIAEDPWTYVYGVGDFVVTFVGSTIVGVLVGLWCTMVGSFSSLAMDWGMMF